jgi:ABC-2 type transport system permease protein
MNTESGAVPDSSLDAPAAASTNLPATRPLFWSVQRELWENRSIYVAPLVTAAVFLFGFSLSMIHLPRRMRALSALEPAQQAAAIVTPYSTAAVLIMFTAFVVALFYCLDALYGERRDRSILFWKSLPVSDRTAVLAKACIPVLVLPLLTSAIVLATQLVMLPLNTAVLLASGVGTAKLWTDLPLFQMSLIQPYGLAVHALWHAPLYAWLLLVSAWARRTPVLWAVLPPAAIGAVEHIAFGTSYFGALLGHRVMGAMRVAFTFEAERGGVITQLTQLTPGRFLGSAGLWLGLLFAAAFLAAATRLRRNRGPI